MGVILNQWTGNEFENATTCTRCGRLATVNEITMAKSPDIVLARLCKGCLEEAVWEIDNSILAATGET